MTPRLNKSDIAVSRQLSAFNYGAMGDGCFQLKAES